MSAPGADPRKSNADTDMVSSSKCCLCLRLSMDCNGIVPRIGGRRSSETRDWNTGTN